MSVIRTHFDSFRYSTFCFFPFEKQVILFLLLIITICTPSDTEGQCTIQDITINGNHKTKTSFLMKLIDTCPNETLDSAVLKGDINQLIRLPSISHAYYEINSTEGNTCDVIIGVEENFTFIPDINFWTSTNNVFSWKLGAHEHNLLGRNIAIGGSYQYNGHDSYALGVSAPYLFSKSFGLDLNYLNWKSAEPIFLNEGSAIYLYNNVSTELLGSVHFDKRTTFKMGFNLFRETYTYLEGKTQDGIPLELDIKKQMLKFQFTHSNIQYHFQYLSGFKSATHLQLVHSAEEVESNFWMAWNDLYYFKRIRQKGNWATRFRFGLSTNLNTPFAPFSLDNNVNIRGVGIIVDRGTGTIVLNSEYRYTFLERKWIAMQGVGFIDGGSWRSPGGSFDDFGDLGNVRLFSGIGLRFILPSIYNAIFRIDFGQSLTSSENGIVFGLGQYF